MNSFLDRMRPFFDTHFPTGSTKRKLLQILAVIFIIQGFFIVFLSSYFGLIVGSLSVALGVLLLLLAPAPRMVTPTEDGVKGPAEKPTPGIWFVESLMSRIGDYPAMALGVSIIVAVVLYNQFVSYRSDYGDLDTLAIFFGCVILAYPLVIRRAKVEIVFVLLFIGIVMVLLVIPQALFAKSANQGVMGVYVHYMLAAPMAGILNLIGIPASSLGDTVTITFNDGYPHTLGISAACAGLYSFSIFVSAFVSYVLVFERLPAKLMTFVLAVGLLAAYLGNLFRMVIIGVVGYFNGMDDLLWTHKNVGWMIFLSWSAVFWYLVMRYADKKSGSRSREKEIGA